MTTIDPTYRLTLTEEQRKALLLVCDALLMMIFSGTSHLEAPALMATLEAARTAIEAAELEQVAP